MLTGNRHEDIMFVYEIFSKQMLLCKRPVPFPKNTDPTKTYLYKDLNKFCESVVDELKLDKWDTRQIIQIIVRHAKKRRLLIRGSKILLIKDILDVCKKELELVNNSKNDCLESIKAAKVYLDSNKLNSSRALSSSNSMGGLSNLFQLVNSGVIPIQYLALSKNAIKAYNLIPQSERSGLPSESKLVLLRTQLLLSDKDKKLQEALGDDLYLISLVTTRSQNEKLGRIDI